MVQLSQFQLFDAARFISPKDILTVVRQLGLEELNIQQVSRNLRNNSCLDRSFQLLFAWRNKYPDKCTLQNLVQALNDLNLKKTAEVIEDAIQNERKAEEELRKDDEKCDKKLIVNEKMVFEVSKILIIRLYTSLGLMLGLDEQQLERVTSVFEMLEIWIQQEGSNAVLGRLYTALRLLDYNDDAEKVYDICVKVSLCQPDLLR